MFIDLGANGELGHLEGGTDDVVNISDVDLPGHVQLSASAAFHDVPSGVAFLGIDRKNCIRVCVHDMRQELEQEVPAVDEARHVNTGEEASQVLVEDEGR